MNPQRRSKYRSFRATSLPVLTVAASFLLTPLCRGNSYDEMVAEIRDLEARIADFEAANASIMQLTRKIDEMEQAKEELKREISELETSIPDREFLYQVYRDSYRVVPTSESGAALGNLVLPDGRTLMNAVFVGTARGGIQVSATSGIVSIPVHQIPSSLGDKFNLPGALPVVTSSLDQISTRRPVQLLASSEAGSGGRDAKTEKNTGSAREMSSVEKVQKSTADREAEYNAKKARNDARWKRIEELKAEAETISGKIRQTRLDKQSAEIEFNRRSIRPDRGTVERTLAEFDAQTQQLRDREQEILTEIREVRSAIE